MASEIVTCRKCCSKNRVDGSRIGSAKCGKCGTALDVFAPSSSPADPVVVTDATFDRDVLGVRGKPVLVDFWAAWCGPCRMLAPTLDQLATESNGRYVIAKLNVDENQRTAARYPVDGIPAMFIFKDGQLVDQLIGLAPKPLIASKLSAHI